MKHLSIAFVAIIVLTLSKPASGALPVASFPVDLDLDPCTDIDPARVADLLTLELRLIDVSRLRSRSASPTHVRVECAGHALVLWVAEGDYDVATEDNLDFSAYPAASRARALAIVISQIIERRWRPVASAPPPRPPVPQTEAVVAARVDNAESTPRRPPSRAELAVLASWQTVGQPRRSGSALTLNFDWHFLRWLAIESGVETATLAFVLPAGQVSAPTVSAVVAAGFGLSTNRISLAVGPGLRVGWAWLRGVPAMASIQGQAFNGSWWGPCAVTSASLRLWGPLRLAVRVELGRFARTVIGESQPSDGTDQVALAGSWFHLGGGVGLGF